MSAVIRIDPDDELPAILERLPANASCVLVLPPHARALSSVVGAKLLSRRAAAQGSRVAVVTDDHAVTAHARAAGVPVALTVEEAERLLGGAGMDRAADAEQTVVWRPGEHDDTEPDGPTLLMDTAQPPDEAPAGRDGTSDAAAASGVRGHSGTRTSGNQGGAMAGMAPGPSAHGPQPGGGRVRRGPNNVLVAAVVVLAPLILLGLLANYVLSGILNPSATVTLSPRAVAVPAAGTVHAVRHLAMKRRGPYLLAMSDATQSEQSTVPLPVRGHKLLPDKPASGTVLLGNLTTKALFVPRGTTFTTALNKVAFVSTRDVTLPAATESFTETVYGTSIVPVGAATGGSAGNVAKGAIVNVPASLSGALKVTNEAPMHGGTDKTVPDIAPHDLQVASASLFGALIQEARHNIARRFNGGVEQHNLSVSYSPITTHLAANRRSATLTLSVLVHVIYVHTSDLEPAVTAALHPVLDTMPSATLLPSSVTWDATWAPDDPITQTISLAITGRVSQPLDKNSILRAISGKSKAQALAYLQSRKDVVSPSITINPPWSNSLPGDVTRIQLNVGTAR